MSWSRDTQEQFAERADVSVRFISFLETNRRQPTLTMIAAISYGLGITMAGFAADIEATVAMARDMRGSE